jgi:hypothetical protein
MTHVKCDGAYHRDAAVWGERAPQKMPFESLALAAILTMGLKKTGERLS